MLTHMLVSSAEADGARRSQSSLMKYSSLEFKDFTVGPVQGRPRDRDVSRSFTVIFLSCFPVLLMRQRQKSLVKKGDFASKERGRFFSDFSLIG